MADIFLKIKQEKDDFYNITNQKILRESISRLERGMTIDHELIGVDEAEKEN